MRVSEVMVSVVALRAREYFPMMKLTRMDSGLRKRKEEENKRRRRRHGNARRTNERERLRIEGRPSRVTFTR